MKSDISSSLLPSLADLEVICIKIAYLQSHDHMTVCNCYIPPNSSESYISALISFLTDLLSTHNDVIIMGDFNFPDINWSSLTGHSHTSTLFSDFMFDNNLTQHVDCPTHTRGNILDLVLTANDELVDNLVVSNPNHSIRSDHLMISLNLLFQPTSIPSQRRLYGTESLFVYDFPKADMEGICSYLENSNFRHCFVSCDVDFVWSSLKREAALYNDDVSRMETQPDLRV